MHVISREVSNTARFALLIHFLKACLTEIIEDGRITGRLSRVEYKLVERFYKEQELEPRQEEEEEVTLDAE